MAKVVLADLSSFSNISNINDNFRKIEEALDKKVLWRDNPDGYPNQMENALDMNSNDIINAGLVRAKHIVAESVSSGEKFPIAGGLADNEMIKWDKATGQLVGTGVKSNKEGEITTANNSVNIGVHDVGSAGRNVIITNRVDNRHFFPVVQEIGLQDSNTTAPMSRDHGNLEELQLYTGMSEIIADPNWSTTTTVNRTVLGVKFWPQTDMTNVIYRIYDQGTLVFEENIGDFTAGNNTSYKTLQTPYDLYHDSDYTFSLSSVDGTTYFKGDDRGKPWFHLQIRPFEMKELATQEYVAHHGGGTGGGDMFKSVYDKNGNDIVDEAEALTGATAAGNSKYYGTDGTGQVGFFDIPTSEVSASQFNALETTVQGHTTALNNHGSEIQQHENEISTNTNNIQVAMQHSQSALTEANQVRSSMVTGIVPTVDHTAKTITFTLTSNSGAVDHALVDLSSWFGTGPAPQDFAIWSGWSQNPPMGEAEIQRLGTKRIVRSLNGLEIILSRSDTTPKHMWVWIPSAHPAKGFNFSGFTSVWQSHEVNVAGVDGKFYYSPNPTSATNVNFEVEV